MLKDDASLKLAEGLRGGGVFDGRIYPKPRKPLKEKSSAAQVKYKAMRKKKKKIATMSSRRNR